MLDSLTTYFPDNFIDMGYEDLRTQFAEGEYAMFISGSWEIAVLDELGADTTKVGWFPAPVKNEGDKLQYVYHVDAVPESIKTPSIWKLLLWNISNGYRAQNMRRIS